jgi:dTDP-glucose 4,6-dehydratase
MSPRRTTADGTGGRTLLVTGGAGFIGSNFVRLALERGVGRMVNLDKLTYAGSLASLADLEGRRDHVFVQGDIGDRELVRDLLARHRPWAVVNFAAESHVDRSILGPSEFLQTNVVGTFHLLEAARAYWRELGEGADFRFLQISTDEVYGTLGPDDPPFTERTPYTPNSPYAASKAAADHFVRAYHRTFGFPALTTHCSNNYGPYQFPEKLIPVVILSALDGQPVPVYGDGLQVRDWLYVEDHCDAILRVLERGRPGETYNVGGGNQVTNLELVREICALLDEHVPDSPHRPHARLISHVADRPGHDRRYAIDETKIRTELGWQTRTDLVTGLARTVRWYLEHGAWISQVRGGAHREWMERNYARRGGRTA